MGKHFYTWFLMLFALLCCGNAMANTSSEMKPYNIGTPNLDLGNANLGNWEQYLGGYYLDAEDSTYKYTEWEEVTETDRIALINGTKDPVISCWDFPTSPDDRITVRVGSYKPAENNNEREKAAAERLVYRFKVTEDMGALLYRYAPVLHIAEQSPILPRDHTDEQEPNITISVSLYDTLTGESEVLPNSVSIASKDELERPAEGSTCRSSISRYVTEFAYHTWTDKKIDLSEYIGKVLKIEVINHDCLRVSSDGEMGPGSHISYGYFCAEVIPAKPVVANYLTFTAEESGSSFSLINTKGQEPDLEYSFDGGNTWATLHANEQVTFANVGDSAMLRGNNPKGFSSPNSIATFSMTGRIAASGSVTSLIDGEGLSTTIPQSHCFCYLFQNCTSLTQAPELPATQVNYFCYGGMFKGCDNLKQAPELPATVLDYACYYEMFKGCTSLTKAPQLPATELKDGCYSYMFENCTGLSQAPELPATTLEDSCYMNMFSGCTSLTRAPELPATELIRYCYMNMFNGCTNLNYIKVGITTLDSDETDATYNWVKGVDNEGTFIFPCGSTYDKHGLSEVPNNFTIISSPIVIFQNPDETELWRDTLECGSVPEYRGVTPTFQGNKIFLGWDKELTTLTEPGAYYYTAMYEEEIQGEKNYLTFTAEESGSSFSLINTKQEEPNLEYSSDGGNTWATLHANEQVTFANVGDSVMLRGINPNGFSGFPEPAYFTMKGRIAASGSVMSLIDGEGISTTIPHQECFCYLFQNCTSLTQAPELPATDVTQSCYRFMFKGCTNLKQAPELPATVLDYACYYEMFKGCTSLTQAPQLPATELKDGCYSYMFENCTGLTQAPELPATTLEDSCYMNMFSGCTSLTRAPELPATELIRYCYMNMFNGCTNLNYIKVGITTLDSDETDATNNWVKGVDNKGTFIFPCGSTYNKHGLSEVPNNFTIISSPIVIFQNPDETELWRDTIECGSVPEYRGVTPTLGEDKYVFFRWNMELEALEEPGIYYYTAQYAIQQSNPDDNSADNCTVWTEGLTIFVGDAQGSVKVYNLNGQLIHSVEGETSVSHAITMPAHGVYIVKIGKNSIKVEL